MDPHIFISYNREDQHRARTITDALEAEGLKVWWDTNLRAGESYDEVTEKHLREAGAVVVLWSKKSAGSKWVRAEATVGERFSKLVPVMIEECERPLRFELVQTADLTRWHGDPADPNWRNFIHAVKSAIGQHHEETEPTAPDAPVPAGDTTIENTFWTSIKDGKERSDFEAYLKRYPDGHFADLARNRLAALDRAEQETNKPQPAPPPPQPPKTVQQASPPPRQQPRPQQATAESNRPAAVQPEAVRQSAPAKKSNTGMLAMLALGVVILGVGGFFALNMLNSGPPDTTVASTQTKADALTTTQAEDDAALEDEASLQTVSALSATEDTIVANGPEENVTADTSDVMQTDESADSVAASPGDVFADCDFCPQMKILPAGTFMMGSPADEPGRFPYEGPQHEVVIESFAIGTHEITFDQWAACVDDGGCNGYTPGDAGLGRGTRPALYISWQDAQSYVSWLSQKTGRSYRLPSEAEWEYAARGGNMSAYWWGDRFDRAKAALGGTVEIGTLAANGFGLHEVLGNAGEWVQDCYINNYTESPLDGSPVMAGDCGRRVVRGGSWRGDTRELRSASRVRITSSVRDRALGFRVAAELE